MTTKLIGFAGKARSGKTTAAKCIGSMGGTIIRSFADPIKNMISVMLDLNAREIEEHKSTVIEGLDTTPRKLMQSLGTDWGRRMIRDDIWIRIAAARAAADLERGFTVVFDDVRFQNEVDMILRNGGQVFRIVRPSLTSTDTHESENQELTGLAGTIVNDGTLEQFQNNVREMIK